MEKKNNQKIHNRKGFTLAETLLAVLIQLMVSQIVATGIPVAKNAYEKVVLTSNAEVLLSTAVTALRNELGTAREIDIPDSQTITYLNSTRGSMSKIGMETDPADSVQMIMLHRYAAVNGIGTDSGAERLISKEAATADLYVTFAAVTSAPLSSDPDSTVVTFTDVSVRRKSGSELTRRDKLSINVLAH